MNIWCISKYGQPPKYGSGFGFRPYYIAKELAKLGHKTTLITSDSNHFGTYPDTTEVYNREDLALNLKLIWLKTKKFTKTASISRILSWFDFEFKLFRMDRSKLEQPDVVLVSSLSLLTIIYGYYLKKKYGAFLVFEIRDIWPLTMIVEGGFSKYHPLVIFLGFVERFGYKKSDLIVGTMPRLDLHVRETLGFDRPFHCSPIGYSNESIKDDHKLAPEVVNKYFPKDKIIIGYAGSLGITNALDPYMECIEQMPEDSNIHFVIVGGGDLRDTYIDKLSHKSNVQFMPKISKNEVHDFLERCDILYLSMHDSLLWKYGQSLNKIVDYMRAGKPVIASFSGYMTMLNEADCGTIVPANNTNVITKAINDLVGMTPEERQEMGLRGQKYILKKREYGQITKNLYDAICKLRPSLEHK